MQSKVPIYGHPVHPMIIGAIDGLTNVVAMVVFLASLLLASWQSEPSEPDGNFRGVIGLLQSCADGVGGNWPSLWV